MAREQLQTAADTLADAADAADGEAAERLTELADQLETLSTRDRAPDHGRLARIQNALGELDADAGSALSAAIAEADDAIDAFRETIEGV